MKKLLIIIGCFLIVATQVNAQSAQKTQGATDKKLPLLKSAKDSAVVAQKPPKSPSAAKDFGNGGLFVCSCCSSHWRTSKECIDHKKNCEKCKTTTGTPTKG